MSFMESTENTVSHFEKLRRAKKLDFSLVELYSHFLAIFFENTETNKNFKKHLRNIKIKKDGSLKKTDKPTLYISAGNGKVERLNAEAMKALRLKKSELKDKLLMDFYEPRVSVESLFEKGKFGQNESLLLFFRKTSKLKSKQKSYQSYYAKVSQRSENNKVLYVIEL